MSPIEQTAGFVDQPNDEVVHRALRGLFAVQKLDRPVELGGVATATFDDGLWVKKQ
jgi:hypothetical protein